MGARVGLIANALDNQTQDIRSKIINREKDALSHLGYNLTEIDLRHFFKDSSKLSGHLATFDLLWVTGGNAFILNVAMNLSGFRRCIAKLFLVRLRYAGKQLNHR